jgi:hypothetical protein
VHLNLKTRAGTWNKTVGAVEIHCSRHHNARTIIRPTLQSNEELGGAREGFLIDEWTEILSRLLLAGPPPPSRPDIVETRRNTTGSQYIGNYKVRLVRAVYNRFQPDPFPAKTRKTLERDRRTDYLGGGGGILHIAVDLLSSAVI